MKNLNWKQWTAIGIIAAVVVTAVVLHFVQPEVSYAFTEFVSLGTFVLGGVAGYLLRSKNIIND